MGRHSPEIRGRVVAVVIASAVGLGCRAVPPRQGEARPAASQPKGLSASAGIKADSGVVPAGFTAKAEPGQELGVHMDMGRGHEAQGQFEAAAVNYQKALDSLEKAGPHRGQARVIAEQKGTAHRKLAVVLDRLGRFGESDAHYKAALKLSPDDPKVWNNAGYSLYIQGRWEEAGRTLRTASRLAPGDPKVATNLGLALAAGGKVDEAFAVMSKAVGPAAAHADIGYVLASTGRRAEALAQYREALTLQPGLPVAVTALAQLGKAGGTTVTATSEARTADLPPLPEDASVTRASGESTSAPKRGLFGQRRR